MDNKNDDSGGSDSLDKSLQQKCVVDDIGQGEGAASSDSVGGIFQSSTEKQKTAKHGICDSGEFFNVTENVEKNTSSPNEKETQYRVKETSVSVSSNMSSTSENIAAKPNNHAFETKVIQISKDLKETTLAESSNNKDLLNSSESVERPFPSPSGSNQDDTNQHNTIDSNLPLGDLDSSTDEHDNRSKKVRFHPDVKENDGGNRVIPKKKKKCRSTSGDDDEASTSSHRLDDDMDYEEEDESEEKEDEFDLNKTIAEAQDYLKQHPLTFVRPQDKMCGRLQNGLLEEEDMPPVCDDDEDDFYTKVPIENGVERLLGKQVKNGKVEYLMRYAGHSGLFWESEDLITDLCPNLLIKYEQNREQRQERLMRHVAKRQNIRQRYTDF